MSRAKVSIHLHTGAMARPIIEQVHDQRLRFKGGANEALRFQRAADSITYLSVHGYISQRAADTARQRLLRNLADAVVYDAKEQP